VRISVRQPSIEYYMNNIEYVKLNEVNPKEFIPLLNKQKVRDHLIDHKLFDEKSVKAWLESKVEVDSSQGCKVRAIVVDNQLIGWCGIQPDDENFELAVVIDDNYWGLGKKIFLEIMAWAREFGHKTVFIHFLYTRPEYKFLRKISKRVYENEILGSKFTTYELVVK